MIVPKISVPRAIGRIRNKDRDHCATDQQYARSPAIIEKISERSYNSVMKFFGTCRSHQDFNLKKNNICIL
jgi:hypothetical protein